MIETTVQRLIQLNLTDDDADNFKSIVDKIVKEMNKIGYKKLFTSDERLVIETVQTQIKAYYGEETESTSPGKEKNI